MHKSNLGASDLVLVVEPHTSDRYNVDHTINYFSVISRFIGELLWTMDSVSRGLYLDRLDEVANELAEETLVPWFESGLPAIDGMGA